MRPLRFNIDLVLYDAQGQPQLVLDSKYKLPDAPGNPDFNQVLVYAQAKGCQQAVLVYPEQLKRPLDVTLAGVRVRSLAFPLHGDMVKTAVFSWKTCIARSPSNPLRTTHYVMA
jgi:5-methylcytosine-specific restriction enzyme subunit McrC